MSVKQRRTTRAPRSSSPSPARRAARPATPQRGARSPRRSWLPIALTLGVVAVVVAFIAFIAATRPAPAASTDKTGVVVARVTNVPAGTFDAVGTGGLKSPLHAPAPSQPGAAGRPALTYIGAEYCPYCASERWSLVVALSRFGTFDGLKLTTSSSTDVYPNTPTLTFHGATYRSDYLAFTAYETADRTGKPLENLPTAAQARLNAMNPGSGIPFLDLDGRWYTVGSGYPPDVLNRQDWTQIANALQNPSSPTTKAVIGNANYLTAGICRLTGAQPASVCSSVGVKAADAAIK